MASGSLTATVPWADISLGTDTYIDSLYLPEGITLRDPSKLKKEDTARLMAFWRKRQEEHGPRECFQFSHYLGGGREKELRVAEYPMETVQTDRIGFPSRTKKRGRKGRGKKTQKEMAPTATLAPAQTPPMPTMYEPTPLFPAMNPIPLTPAPALPEHSYTHWPPAPTADGTGPMDEIRLHEQRMELERSRRARARAAPAPVIDPRLLGTPERGVQETRPNIIGSTNLVTPGRRTVMEVIMTPRRRPTVTQPQRSTPLAPLTPRPTRSQNRNLAAQTDRNVREETPRTRQPGTPRRSHRTQRRVPIVRDDLPPANEESPAAPPARPRPRPRQMVSAPHNSDAFFIRNRRPH